MNPNESTTNPSERAKPGVGVTAGVGVASGPVEPLPPPPPQAPASQATATPSRARRDPTEDGRLPGSRACTAPFPA